MDPTTTFEGRVYLLRVRDVVEGWDDHDLVYVVAHDGEAGLSFGDLKTLCEKKNGKWLLTKLANKTI